MQTIVSAMNMAFKVGLICIVVERIKQNPEQDVFEVFDSTFNMMLMHFKGRYQDNEETIK